MRIDTDEKKTAEVVERSIDEIIPSKEEFLKALRSGRRLTFYVGIDPTANYVHLGHSTNYLLLERLHKLGHRIIVLVGDFTAMIGDPSDKTAMRNQLSAAEVQENLKTFKRQIGKILDFDNRDNPIEFKFNSDWLSGLTFQDAVELAANFTVQQMIERDAFQKRMKENKPLYVHEFFYPLMQGYDSVVLDTDCEIGGTDQLFNMLAGRTLLKRYKNKEKFVITTTLLENPETGEKLMSKSLGTGIALEEPANDMFRKVMELPDCALRQLFMDCTRMPIEQIDGLMKRIEEGENPRDVKLILATEITTIYHGAKAAEEAKENWIETISKKQVNAEELSVAKFETTSDPIEVIAELMGCSKSQVRRLFAEKAVRVGGEVITPEALSVAKTGEVLAVGKKHRFRIENEA